MCRYASFHYMLRRGQIWVNFAATLSLWDTRYTWGNLVLILSSNSLNQGSVWATALFLRWEGALTPQALWIFFVVSVRAGCNGKSQTCYSLQLGRPQEQWTKRSPSSPGLRRCRAGCGLECVCSSAQPAFRSRSGILTLLPGPASPLPAKRKCTKQEITHVSAHGTVAQTRKAFTTIPEKWTPFFISVFFF